MIEINMAGCGFDVMDVDSPQGKLKRVVLVDPHSQIRVFFDLPAAGVDVLIGKLKGSKLEVAPAAALNGLERLRPVG